METYQTHRKPNAYWKRVHKRIAASKALDTCIAYADGDDSISGSQARMAYDLVKMTVPQFQAIAVKHESSEPASIGQIEALLLQAGVDPGAVLAKDNVLTEEKTVIEHDVIESTPTHECE